MSPRVTNGRKDGASSHLDIDLKKTNKKLNFVKKMWNQILKDLLSSDSDRRKSGEKSLSEMQASDPDYALRLLHSLQDKSNALDVRQMSAVLIKQYILARWGAVEVAEDRIMHTDSIKEVFRRELPNCLGDEQRAVRIGTARALAAIASFDWPMNWPQLMDTLIGAISGSTDCSLVDGSMHVLTELAQIVSEKKNQFSASIEGIVHALLPHLIKIVISDYHFTSTRKRAIDVFHVFATTISENKVFAKRTLVPWICSYCEVFLAAEDRIVKGSAAEIWDLPLLIKIVQVLCWMCDRYAKLLHKNYGVAICLNHVHLFQLATNMYISRIETQKDNLDSSNDETLDNLLFELCDFIEILSSQKSFGHVFPKHLREIMHSVVYLMQVSSNKIEEWASNARQYIEEEDEDGLVDDVRTAAKNLILSLVEDHAYTGLQALCDSALGHLNESEHSKILDCQKQCWWRQREASLTALGLTANDLVEGLSREQNSIADSALSFDLPFVLTKFVFPGIEDGAQLFLRGTCVWFLARIAPLLPQDWTLRLVEVCALYLAEDNPILMRVAAVRALFSLNTNISAEASAGHAAVFAEHGERIATGLIRLAKTGGEPVVSLVLSTLITCVKANVEVAASMENKLVPLVTACAVRYCGDAVIPSQAVETIEILYRVEAIRSKIEERLLPTVISILDKSEDAKLPLRLPAVSMELLEAVLRLPNEPLSELLLNRGFPAVVGRILRTRDSDTLLAGRDCLRAYLSRSGPQLISWHENRGGHLISQTVGHYLEPGMPDTVPLMVPRLILALVGRGDDSKVRPFFAEILQALVARMAGGSGAPGVRRALSIACCYFLIFSTETAMDILAAFRPVPSNCTEGDITALTFVLTEWLQTHRTLIGEHDRRISTMAICKLLEFAAESDRGTLFDFSLPSNQRPVLSFAASLLAEDLSHFERDTRAKGADFLAKIGIFEPKRGNFEQDCDYSSTDECASNSSGVTQNMPDLLADVIPGLANDDLEEDGEGIMDLDMNGYLADFLGKFTLTSLWMRLTLSDNERLLLLMPSESVQS